MRAFKITLLIFLIVMTVIFGLFLVRQLHGQEILLSVPETLPISGDMELLTVLVLLICMSVCFVKQHSVLDVAAAVPVALIAELLVFRKDWTERFRRRKEKK